MQLTNFAAKAAQNTLLGGDDGISGAGFVVGSGGGGGGGGGGQSVTGNTDGNWKAMLFEAPTFGGGLYDTLFFRAGFLWLAASTVFFNGYSSLVACSIVVAVTLCLIVADGTQDLTTHKRTHSVSHARNIHPRRQSSDRQASEEGDVGLLHSGAFGSRYGRDTRRGPRRDERHTHRTRDLAHVSEGGGSMSPFESCQLINLSKITSPPPPPPVPPD